MTTTGVVERLLAGRIGLDVSTVGDGLIARGVLARMSALGLGDRADYEWLLGQDDGELQALIEEIVIPESWFFRDDRPFALLREHARSGWLADDSRPPLTALSIPCAGGEEPYSIALALIDLGLPPARFRVDASDVSGRSLARAIAGVYGPNSFRGEEAAVSRSRHFRAEGGVFAIDPAVKASVHFRPGNLLDDALFVDRPPFDVVFCRNLLIYFDAPARRRAFGSLGRLVADGGLLFLGHADRPDAADGTPFARVAEKGSFAYRKGPAAPGRAGPIAAPVPARATRPGKGPEPRKAGPARPGAGPSPAAPRRGPDPPASRGDVAPAPPAAAPPAPAGSSMGRASDLADLGHYDEASRMVEGIIAGGGATAGAFFLLGLIRQAAGDRDRAEAHFLKAIYLDAQHDEALTALALLARRKGDVAAESSYRRRAERVLARKGAP